MARGAAPWRCDSTDPGVSAPSGAWHGALCPARRAVAAVAGFRARVPSARQLCAARGVALEQRRRGARHAAGGVAADTRPGDNNGAWVTRRRIVARGCARVPTPHPSFAAGLLARRTRAVVTRVRLQHWVPARCGLPAPHGARRQQVAGSWIAFRTARHLNKRRFTRARHRGTAGARRARVGMAKRVVAVGTTREFAVARFAAWRAVPRAALPFAGVPAARPHCGALESAREAAWCGHG